jgi:MoaA/NifB/PqqE/SkfB family radical SAM enzyme
MKINNSQNDSRLDIDKAGRITLRPELMARYHLQPGGSLRLEETASGLEIQLPSRLAKLYIEPTSQCNLDCVTCMRNAWNEPQGLMSEAVFARILEGLEAFSPKPSVFIGGFGEPLFHPQIVNMVGRLTQLGINVELITNGTLLTGEMSYKLMEAGLATLWVSLDGATPESYADIRLGATLPKVLENLAAFHKIANELFGTERQHSLFSVKQTQLGIAFVAMKRNIKDLPAVIDLGHRYGAEHFMVTNVLPYTRDMIDETLYYRALINNDYKKVHFPDIDANETTYAPVYHAIRNVYSNWSGFSTQIVRNKCPFITNGAGAVSWNGDFSPCLPLLHSYTSYLGYLQNDQRASRRWAVGNIMEKSLAELWNTPEHKAFRERVQAFDFAPCTSCGACELMSNNEEDCFGNTFPTCGGCLWAQGVIQCP